MCSHRRLAARLGKAPSYAELKPTLHSCERHTGQHAAPRTHNGQLRVSRDILRTHAAREEILHLFHNYLLSSDTGQRRSVEARSAGADKRSHLKPNLYTLFTLGELRASGLDSSLKNIIKIVHIIKSQRQTMCVMQRKEQQCSVFPHYETVRSSCEFLK